MNFITQFGDLSLLMPLSFLLSISLWRFETKEAARAFVATLMLCLFVMFVFKLFFLSCGDNLLTNVASPSGHTAASTFVFGSIGLVMSTHAPRWGRVPILVAITLLVVTIAISRVYVGAHSIAEVAIAFLVGASFLLFFAITYSRLSHPRVNFWMLALAFVISTALLYGFQLPAEPLIRKWSLSIHTQTSVCTALKIPGSFEP